MRRQSQERAITGLIMSTFFDPDKHPEMEPRRPIRPHDDAQDDESVPDISKKDWMEGDRVLAPWTRAWLYPGTVGKVGDEEVFVYFDDGDRGWAAKEQVRPLPMLAAGSKVHCRWQGGTEFYPGTITQLNGEQIFVQYDDGDSEWTVLGMIAVPSGLSPTPWEIVWGVFWGMARFWWVLLILTFCLYRACR
jgi:hypothetical protein